MKTSNNHVNKGFWSKFFLYVKAIGTSIITALLILKFLPKGESSCPALEYFIGESSVSLFSSFIKAVFITVGIWSIGFGLFALSSIKDKVSPYIYFSLITFVSMSGIIFNSLNKEPVKVPEIAYNICNKATVLDYDRYMKFNNLTVTEYKYINSKQHWLPEVPINADSIYISYFHESFNGDFDLTIDLILPKDQTLDSLEYPKWTKTINGYHFNEIKM